MGSAKDQMKPSTPAKKDDNNSGFNKLKAWRSKRKKRPQSEEEKAQTIADMVMEIDSALESLITTKESELKTETNREPYNRRALARLELMQYHIDKIAELGEEYLEDS